MSDAAYTALIYCVVAIIAPRSHPLIVAAAAVLASCAVELFQLTGIPRALAETTPAIGLVLGVEFQAENLATYVCAGVLLLILDWVTIQTRRSLTNPTS
ncbi:DUF2809 domain-containing protein [Leifsonia sp. NPDC102414]|uniref:DUF2809 domain-containing protein n=1 Tax=Leifsonia sp. NPDC102414 TaxID=3364124 RepID=UPI0037F97A2E